MNKPTKIAIVQDAGSRGGNEVFQGVFGLWSGGELHPFKAINQCPVFDQAALRSCGLLGKLSMVEIDIPNDRPKLLVAVEQTLLATLLKRWDSCVARDLNDLSEGLAHAALTRTHQEIKRLATAEMSGSLGRHEVALHIPFKNAKTDSASKPYLRYPDNEVPAKSASAIHIAYRLQETENFIGIVQQGKADIAGLVDFVFDPEPTNTPQGCPFITGTLVTKLSVFAHNEEEAAQVASIIASLPTSVLSDFGMVQNARFLEVSFHEKERPTELVSIEDAPEAPAP